MFWFEVHDLRRHKDPCRFGERLPSSLVPLSRADTWTVYAVLEAAQLIVEEATVARRAIRSPHPHQTVRSFTGPNNPLTTEPAIHTRSIPPPTTTKEHQDLTVYQHPLPLLLATDIISTYSSEYS